MPPVTFTPPTHWQDWVSWVLGLWLCISPWALGFSADSASTQNAVVVGFLLILTEVVTLSVFAPWEEWLNVVLGAWSLGSPPGCGVRGGECLGNLGIGLAVSEQHKHLPLPHGQPRLYPLVFIAHQPFRAADDAGSCSSGDPRGQGTADGSLNRLCEPRPIVGIERVRAQRIGAAAIDEFFGRDEFCNVDMQHGRAGRLGRAERKSNHQDAPLPFAGTANVEVGRGCDLSG